MLLSRFQRRTCLKTVQKSLTASSTLTLKADTDGSIVYNFAAGLDYNYLQPQSIRSGSIVWTKEYDSKWAG
jgi:hypothetical protein